MNKRLLTNTSNPDRPSRGRWLLIVLVIHLFLGFGAVALMAFYSRFGTLRIDPEHNPDNSEALRYVVGDLGGMPVRIDRRVVHFVEYDGDPGWGERRAGPVPRRTSSSKLNSFGFYARYPDLGSLSDPEVREDFERYQSTQRATNHGAKIKTTWLDGAVLAGEHYLEHGSLDRFYNNTIGDPDRRGIGRQFISADSPVDGLQLFIPRGTDPVTGELWRYVSAGAGDIYIHRNSEGRVSTYIRCGYSHGTRYYAGCEQNWDMEQHDLSINVSVRYTPDLLPQWRSIQAKLTDVILGFRDQRSASK
jgi:hypothetical protein